MMAGFKAPLPSQRYAAKLAIKTLLAMRSALMLKDYTRWQWFYAAGRIRIL